MGLYERPTREEMCKMNRLYITRETILEWNLYTLDSRVNTDI